MIANPWGGMWVPFLLGVGNHLWQSTLFALVIAGLAFVLRKNHARTRYWLWLAASAKFLIPFSLLVVLGGFLARLHPASGFSEAKTSAASYVVMGKMSQPFKVADDSPVVTTFHRAAAIDERVSVAARVNALLSPITPLQAALGVVWISGLLTVVVTWITRWWRMSAAIQRAVPLLEGREVDALRRMENLGGLRRSIELRLLPASVEPGIFGFVRPILLWPQAMSQRLDDSHLEAILAHEVCHVRRIDNLTAAMHMVVEAVFWFHPLVWWLETRLVQEREWACDEEVMRLVGQRDVYAESILKVCEFCIETTLRCVSGVSGADLKRRVAQIMALSTVRNLDLGRKTLLAVVGLMAFAVPLAFGLAGASMRPQRAFDAHSSFLAQQQTSPLITFAAANVHSSPQSIYHFARSSFSNDRYEIRQASMVDLIVAAYGVDSNNIVGGPTWLETNRFDIYAETPPHTSADDVKLMLRALLIERFKLKLHTAKEPLPAFVLAAGTAHPKMKRSDGSVEPNCHRADEPRDSARGTTPLTIVSCHNTSMDSLSQELRSWAPDRLDKPIVNSTGMNGGWDFDIKFHTGSRIALAGADAINIFDAVDRQLGLKLELKTATLPVIFVESVDENPTPNSPDIAKFLPPPPAPEFEVATIRLSRPDEKTDVSIDKHLVKAQAVNLTFMIAFAYNISEELSEERIVGAPKFVDSNKYDLFAKDESAEIPGAPQIDFEELQAMMRKFLADRFHLIAHMEDRPIEAYALVAVSPKLKKADPANRTRCEEGPGPDGRDPRISNPILSRLVTCQNVTMAQLAEQLPDFGNGYIDTPVLDSTNLEGAYDFTLSFSSAGLVRASTAETNSAVGSDPNGAISLFSAINKQLGLKLEKTKHPVPVLVVDHIDQKPTDN
jgi:uncharacterized protein (TIGR03435 family)